MEAPCIIFVKLAQTNFPFSWNSIFLTGQSDCTIRAHRARPPRKSCQTCARTLSAKLRLSHMLSSPVPALFPASSSSLHPATIMQLLPASTLLLQLLLLVCLTGSCLSSALPLTYNTSSGPVSDKLNVHLVPHTHDDVGWLKTVDEYYTGSNNSIQNAAVNLILDTVVTALQEDTNRKFIYVEQAFFQRWWREQTLKKQKVVKGLVNSGQLEFINGGWCMHDEATTHYIDMIDQTTLGHRHIKQQFGKVPRIGWQIDPFGHSAVQGYLLSGHVGFDAVYFARIDYQDKSKRTNESTLEMVWQGSRTLGSSAQVFAGAFLEGYGPPSGFSFDVDSTDTPIQDDPLLFDYNVQDRVNDFVLAAETQAASIRTNHIMWTMGTDFTYQNAHGWFKEMDKFINYVNQDGRVNAFYSTPSIYTNEKYAANETWPLKLDDFFPYADDAHNYWTGYFTSRPELKGYVRMLSGYYLMARQLEVIVGKKHAGPNTDALGDAMAIAQHHDAVSGTEQQHTADDYAKRLSIGAAEVMETVNLALSHLTEPSQAGSTNRSNMKLNQCLLLNVSFCPSSETNISQSQSLVVVAYNALGWNRSDYVRIPVTSNSLQVVDSAGATIPSQLIPFTSMEMHSRSFNVQAYTGTIPTANDSLYWLVFPATVPAFGYASYVVAASSGKDSATISSIISKASTDILGFGDHKLKFSHKTGDLEEAINIKAGVNSSIRTTFMYYGGNSGHDKLGTDGAYIFRPSSNSANPVNSSVHTTIIKGPLVNELRRKLSPWVYEVIRQYKDRTDTEVEFMVGPIPVDDGVGKDVIVRFITDIQSKDAFYTDSNGRDFIKRVKNYREDWHLEVNEPVAGNYYPINLGMYIKDDQRTVSVLVDRAVGGTSLQNGQLELMLHRRLLHDDNRGVGQALNETVCVGSYCEGLMIQGRLWINVDTNEASSRWRRTTGQEIYSPLHLAFTIQDEQENWLSSHVSTFSAMAPGYNLPENVALITLQELDDGSVLLRLAHLYQAGEDQQLSSPTTVDLKKVLAHREISSITELSLTANQDKASMRPPLQWRIEGTTDQTTGVSARGAPVDPEKLEVELKPMEIRTFSLLFA